jgi:hypothetical protein
MKCSRCQHENPSAVKFCGECGARESVQNLGRLLATICCVDCIVCHTHGRSYAAAAPYIGLWEPPLVLHTLNSLGQPSAASSPPEIPPIAVTRHTGEIVFSPTRLIIRGKMPGKLVSLSGSNMSQEEILPLNKEM